MKQKKLVSSWVFLLAFTASLFSTTNEPTQDFTKTINKEFPISSDGSVVLENKHGSVDIQTWDRDRVKVKVVITVQAKNESKAQEVFEQVQINFDNNPSLVKATTFIEKQKKGWWDWGSSTKDFRIDYDVFLPGSVQVDLKHSYGDVYVAELKSKASVMVSNGNIRMEGVEGPLTLSLAYGKGKVVDAGELRADLKYCTLEFGDIGEGDITSRYSKIAIDEAKKVRIASRYDTYDIGHIVKVSNEGKYDKFTIDEVRELSILTRYTDVIVENLEVRVDCNMKYGGLAIEKLSREFSRVDLEGSYAGFKIGMEKGTSYRLEASGQYSSINYPSAVKASYNQSDGSRAWSVEGYANNQNAKGIIKAQVGHGGLKIYE